MGRLGKVIGVGAALGALAGCVTTTDPYAAIALQKGEQLNIQNILAANPNKRACVQYQAATNTCASIITATISGNIMTTHETAALKIPGTTNTQRVELVTKSTLVGEKACARAGDISITGRDPLSAALLSVTRDTVNQFGGSVCGTYYRSGHGYVVSSVGGNGKPFPPGDTEFQFLTGDVKLRAQ